MKKWLVRFQSESSEKITSPSRVLETIIFANDKLQATAVFQSQYRDSAGLPMKHLHIVQFDGEIE